VQQAQARLSLPSVFLFGRATWSCRKHVRDVVGSAGVDVDAQGEDPVVEFGKVERDVSVEFAADVVVPVRATEAFGEGVAGDRTG